MQYIKKLLRFFNLPFFKDYRTIYWLWIGVSVFMGIFNSLTGLLHNNYKIYKYVFYNLLEKFPLYQPRPEFFDDLNHYGPIFWIDNGAFCTIARYLGRNIMAVNVEFDIVLCHKGTTCSSVATHGHLLDLHQFIDYCPYQRPV